MSSHAREREAHSTDRLPARHVLTPKRERVRTDQFLGLSMDRGAGYTDMYNLSPRAYPALAVRRPREYLPDGNNGGEAGGMVMFGQDLYMVQGTSLYRLLDVLAHENETPTVEYVGEVSHGPKQMVVYGSRLFIFPDKKYVEAYGRTLHSVETDSGIIPNVTFQANTITLPEVYTWEMWNFTAGDGITVLHINGGIPEGDYCIRKIAGRTAYVETTFPTTVTGTVRILRPMPDMERVAVLGDRMYGYSGKTIYISAAGSAFSWVGSRLDGRGAATMTVDGKGDLTACAPWQGYMMFFKSDCICKLLGSRSDSFQLQVIQAPGIPAELSNTLCELAGDLYYHTALGVYRYGYGRAFPERVGTLPVGPIIEGAGGTDGRCYYLCVWTGSAGELPCPHLYLYAPEQSAWYAEDAPPIKHMLYMEGFLCAQETNGRLWLCCSDDRDRPHGHLPNECEQNGPVPSSVTFAPDHTFEPDECRLTGLCLRATSAPGGEMRVLATYASGRIGRDADADAEPVELARIEGGMTDRLLRIPVMGPLCDSVTLRLEMVGEWEIASLVREYEVSR